MQRFKQLFLYCSDQSDFVTAHQDWEWQSRNERFHLLCPAALLSVLVCISEVPKCTGNQGRLEQRSSAKSCSVSGMTFFLWKEWIPCHGTLDMFYLFPTNIWRKHIKKSSHRENVMHLFVQGTFSQLSQNTGGQRGQRAVEGCGYHACLGRKTAAYPHSHSASIWKSLIGTVRDCPFWECPFWTIHRTHLASISKNKYIYIIYI